MEGTYESSGVSIVRGDLASATAFELLKATFNNATDLVDGLVLLDIDLSHYKAPRVGIAVDGVGTKLKYAFVSGQNKKVGVDLVAMCVNDLVRNNLTPLGFGMYFATGEIDLEVQREVVEGVVAGCKLASCVYMSGETAEMPGFYASGEYDIAGFAFGLVDRERRITGQRIREGDIVFGIASSGLHSNGFSKVREIVPPEEVVANQQLLEEILKPTRIYVKPVLDVNALFEIHGWAHVTGSGIIGKLGKIIPEGLCAQIDITSWPIPEIFRLVAQRGNINAAEMFRTFNMGLGMIGVTSQNYAQYSIQELNGQGFLTYQIGSIVRRRGEEKVLLV